MDGFQGKFWYGALPTLTSVDQKAKLAIYALQNWLISAATQTLFRLGFSASFGIFCQPCGRVWRAEQVLCFWRGGKQNAFQE